MNAVILTKIYKNILYVTSLKNPVYNNLLSYNTKAM